MTQAADIAAPNAHPRDDIEAYLKVLAVQRVQLELAIAQALTRVNPVNPLEDRLAVLERRVADLIAGRAPAPEEVLPLSAVEAVVAKSERELEALRLELAEARRETDAAEQPTAGSDAPTAHPGTVPSPALVAGGPFAEPVDGPPVAHFSSLAVDDAPPARRANETVSVTQTDPVPGSAPATEPECEPAPTAGSIPEEILVGARPYSRTAASSANGNGAGVTEARSSTPPRTTVVTRQYVVDPTPPTPSIVAPTLVASDGPFVTEGVPFPAAPPPVASEMEPAPPPPSAEHDQFWEEAAQAKKASWLAKVPFTLLMQVGVAVVVVAVILFTLG
jgi:hypothetical protein